MLGNQASSLPSYSLVHRDFPSPHPYTNMFLLQLVHLIFSWSSVLSWIIFVIDIVLIGLLSLHAYQDGTITFLGCMYPLTTASSLLSQPPVRKLTLPDSRHARPLRNPFLRGPSNIICRFRVKTGKRRTWRLVDFLVEIPLMLVRAELYDLSFSIICMI